MYCELVAVAQKVEHVAYQSEGRWFDPSFSGLHVEVSLTKILNPKLCPMAALLVCECLCMSS